MDDDPSICRSLLRLVRQTGLEGHSYGSAEDFLAAHQSPFTRPTCLVADLQMPGLTGLELQQRLVQSPTQCPMIFISGNGDIPSTVKAMKHGAITFLTKPFDTQDLLRAIAEALGKHQAALAADQQLRHVRQCMSELTERELEVMSWVITGAMNKQIAAELNVVEKNAPGVDLYLASIHGLPGGLEVMNQEPGTKNKEPHLLSALISSSTLLMRFWICGWL